jgi:hypothetical protein
MNKLDKLILEAFGQVSEADGSTKKPKDLPKVFRDAIEKKYGPMSDQDFFSDDLTRYMKWTGTDKETGSVAHKVIILPSFEKMYDEFANIVRDIKTLMRSDDIRKDTAARELFELIRTNFRKLQRYLRTERPDQYALIRNRASLAELHEMFVSHANLILEEKSILKESLWQEIEEAEEEPQPEEAGEETGAVLEDATDTILGRFPTLKAAIVKLQTEDFKEFVDTIDWISPRPTSFRINLKNGQDYILKWTGKTFEAQILGKRYLLSNIAEYQQALDKLAILYKEAPMSGAGTGEPADTDTGGGGGGGEFPGEEGGAEGGEEGGDEVDALGGEEEGEEGGADLGGEEIDFEEPGEEPEA